MFLNVEVEFLEYKIQRENGFTMGENLLAHGNKG